MSWLRSSAGWLVGQETLTASTVESPLLSLVPHGILQPAASSETSSEAALYASRPWYGHAGTNHGR
ncbi:hypothetical protein HJFPF1_01242 [Paramyrothecium foliicola]|nr:hypothetical protein HJFPF1_01242 [Paramyrothecium foliicola]